jgi:hypothetical protein
MGRCVGFIDNARASAVPSVLSVIATHRHQQPHVPLIGAVCPTGVLMRSGLRLVVSGQGSTWSRVAPLFLVLSPPSPPLSLEEEKAALLGGVPWVPG